MEEKVIKSISFSLKMLKQIDELAFKKQVSRAEIVRLAVKEFIKKEN